MYFDFSVNKSRKGTPNKTKNANGYIKAYNISGKIIEDLPNEIWKTHPNYPNYQISNMGRVKNVVYNTLMSLCNDKDGYLLVGLRSNKGRTTCKVHRLVAELFCDNPNNYTTVNHINHIKTDNKSSNLEWCSLKDNVLMQDRKLSPLAKPVIYIDKDNNVTEFESISEAAKYLNVPNMQLRYRLNHPIVQRVKVDWLKGGIVKYK